MICAHAVSVAFKRVQGVESVEVSLKKGVATVKLTPDNTVRIEDLWQSIRKNGFTPRDTKVRVRGDLLLSSGKRQFKVSNTNQTYELTIEKQLLSELPKHSSQTIVIEGVMAPPADQKAAVPIRLTEIK